MKVAILFLTGFFLTCHTGVTDMRIVLLNGEDKPLSIYDGKKIMIVTIPVTMTAQDSLFIKSLSDLSIGFKDQLAIIAVPSYEDGYQDNSLDQLAEWYNHIADSTLVITRGMYIRKASGEMQYELFSWLTHKEQNEHFDEDAAGTGEKFFINEQGVLFGRAGPETGINET
ncbi:MAG TPA: hypothetical protein PLA68_18480, partial [Panacibacter sp.]|nr:hypothetical protein [Panacibacter sp.]